MTKLWGTLALGHVEDLFKNKNAALKKPMSALSNFHYFVVKRTTTQYNKKHL